MRSSRRSRKRTLKRKKQNGGSGTKIRRRTERDREAKETKLEEDKMEEL